ncbi:MAG: DUF4412 domain-containing protein [Crocinitomicaceae bacterium]|nr:DUF4412 domain-containing protein [Crocinitomicaceae bacterium]
MKKIAGIVAIAFAAVLTSCGGADSDTSPFVGKIEFKGNMMGMSSKGSVTMDAENERMTYRMDALEQFLGMDMAMMVDMKNNKTYTISPSKGIYMETEMEKDEMKGELPSKKEVEEMKKEFFSKLEKTGNTKEISGLTCEEYVLKEKVEDVESATIWVNKNMLNRMTSNLKMMEELKKLGAEEMMIGFPMKGSFKANGQSGSFEVTGITEGEDALADFDLSKMKKVSQMEFSKELWGGSAIGDMMEGIEDMEKEGMFDGLEGDFKDLEKELESLKDLDPKDLEKMMEAFK